MRISPRLFALVPAAVAINLVVGGVVKELSLPVFLDTVGTVLVAVLVGFPAGALVGTVSQLLLGLLTGYQYLPFVVIQWLLSLLAATATNRRGFASIWRSLRRRGPCLGWSSCGWGTITLLAPQPGKSHRFQPPRITITRWA